MVAVIVTWAATTEVVSSDGVPSVSSHSLHLRELRCWFAITFVILFHTARWPLT